MSILFRIALPADDTPAPVAVITARQLAALRRYLRAEGDHMGLALIEPDEVIGDSFEARVCPLALAAVTGVFDHDPAVLSVVEEAQSRGRRISIHHCASTAELKLRVHLTSAGGLELDLAYGNAHPLLHRKSVGSGKSGSVRVDLGARQVN